MVETKLLIAQLQRLGDIGSGRDSKILLDKNERTIPYPDAVVSDIYKSISPIELTRYPDQTPLYEKLSAFLGISPKNLLLSNGADGALKILFDTFLGSDDEIVCPDPTYAMINVYAQMFGCQKKVISFNEHLQLDFDSLLGSISKRTKSVILPNPNQPTGTVLQPQEIIQLMELTAEHDVLLILDEAYIEFSNQTSSVKLLSSYPNLCVLRTFSKAWGLAGLRLGFLAASEELIQQLKKVKTLLDINLVAIKAACYLIENYFLVEEYVDEITRSRDWMVSSLRACQIDVISSATNFIHIRPGPHVNRPGVENALQQKGYLVRSAGGTASILDGCIRVTVGPTKQMRPLVDALIELLQPPKPAILN